MHISHCTEQITLYYLYGYSWTQNLRIWKCSWAWTRNHQVGKHCQWKISHHNSKRRRSRTRCTLQPYFYIKGLGNRHQGTIRFQTWDEWHRIFGHMHMGAVKMMKEKEMVLGMEVDRTVEPAAQCTACITAKQHVKPFPKESRTKIKGIGDLTVRDV